MRLRSVISFNVPMVNTPFIFLHPPVTAKPGPKTSARGGEDNGVAEAGHMRMDIGSVNSTTLSSPSVPINTA